MKGAEGVALPHAVAEGELEPHCDPDAVYETDDVPDGEKVVDAVCCAVSVRDMVAVADALRQREVVGEFDETPDVVTVTVEGTDTFAQIVAEREGTPTVPDTDDVVECVGECVVVAESVPLADAEFETDVEGVDERQRENVGVAVVVTESDREPDVEPDVEKEPDGEDETHDVPLCVTDVEYVGEMVLVSDCVADAE